MINWKALFKEAERLAIQVHQGQQYGNFPYEYHLEEVIAILTDYGFSPDNPDTAPILVAGWLHDSLEDTELRYDDILNQFGNEVADLVWLVTDESGKNRKEPKQATYAKTRQNEKAIILKLADFAKEQYDEELWSPTDNRIT